MATRHLRLIELLKMSEKIAAGPGTFSENDKRKINKEIRDRLSTIHKIDATLVNEAECELQIKLHEADRAFGVSQGKISNRLRLLSRRKCW